MSEVETVLSIYGAAATGGGVGGEGAAGREEDGGEEDGIFDSEDTLIDEFKVRHICCSVRVLRSIIRRLVPADIHDLTHSNKTRSAP